MRELALKHAFVMDGRDIGSQVFPDALLKFFMTASLKTRAKRRYLEMKEKNLNVSLEDIRIGNG